MCGSAIKALTYAPDAFHALSGLFCVYKPSGLHALRVRSMIVYNLTRDLNNMEVRPPKDMVVMEGSVVSGKPLSVKVIPSFADHPLVVGPRYQPQDIRMAVLNKMGINTSGVLVMAISDGCRHTAAFRQSSPLQTVEVQGEFGLATDNFFPSGKIIERSTYSHIKQHFLDKITTSIQSTHQADAFHYAGVDIESQEAYEIASRGIVRPFGKSPFLIYSMKCIEFDLPRFTLEIQCVNTTEDDLAELIHQIGIYLKSNAVCRQLRQTRLGHFTLDHALLRKHWTAEHIINNIVLCKDIADPEVWTPDTPNFKPVNLRDIKQAIIQMQNAYRFDAI